MFLSNWLIIQSYLWGYLRTHPLSPEEAQTIVLSLSQWDYHRPDVQDILAAAVLAERYRISFWDALIVHSAEVLGASLL